ncbi:MAG: hypothetical protein ACI4HM_01130 [Ruminococcus sp.]
MKVSNIKNLENALNSGEKEIDFFSEENEKVIKCGLLSTIIFVSFVILILGAVLAVVFGITLIFFRETWVTILFAGGVFALIFAFTILLTLKGIQKIPLSLAIKMRKYTVNKKSGRVLLKRK